MLIAVFLFVIDRMGIVMTYLLLFNKTAGDQNAKLATALEPGSSDTHLGFQQSY